MNTPWSDLLAREGARIDGSELIFDQPEADVRAADGATVAVPLIHLGLIRASGEDSAGFLHNLFSNDVKKLGTDAAQWNSFNSAKGRMLANFLLWRDEAGYVLATSADVAAGLQKKLSMYVLRSKVKLTDAGSELALIGLAGPEAADVLARAGLPCPDGAMRRNAKDAATSIMLAPGLCVVAVPAGQAEEAYRALQEAGARKAGTAAWHLAMIRAGVPLVTAATQEEFVAQMLNYEVIGGVSFNKGCYPGQEIVARTQYLGKLKKRMYRVQLAVADAPRPGDDLYTPEFGEQSAGKLVNVAPAPQGGFEALAVMQTSSAESGAVHVGRPDGPGLSFLDLPYALP